MKVWRRDGKRTAVTLIACVLILGSGSVMGGMLSRLDYMLHSWPPEHRVKQLVVTGNYAKSRLLAELVQHHTKQPVLLVSPARQGNELYFLPYGPEAIKLQQKDLVEFVELVNPKELLFIGDNSFVPEKTVNKLKDRMPSIRVSSGNWAQNARTLASMFKYRKLPDKFARYYDKLSQKSRTVSPGLQ